jgi:hypothetical protein
VVWFFEDGEHQLHLQVDFDPATRFYSIVRRHPDGNVERVEVLGEMACRHLLQAIERDLARAGWRRTVPPAPATRRRY